MIEVIYRIIDLLLRVALYIIIIQAIMSWLVAFNVINTRNDFVRQVWVALDRMTEPLYRPIRRVMPDFGGLDFSPMVVVLIIIILRDILLPYIFGTLMAATGS